MAEAVIDAAPVLPIAEDRTFDWTRLGPFILLHVGALFAVTVAPSAVALATAGVLYVVRMFAITGFYHRYFSHRAFRAPRWFQFVMAIVGSTSAQRGPIWWASHHRRHHRIADLPEDIHSPRQRGFVWSHMLWFCARESYAARTEVVGDLLAVPELRWIDRFHVVPPILLAATLTILGAVFPRGAQTPMAGAMDMLLWGFCFSTVVLYHITYTINSLAHRVGTRRYPTHDDSRNNGVLALITFGEGWHNNHHHYPSSARNGFFWWEVDITWMLLHALRACRLISDLKPVPERFLHPTSSPPAKAAP